MNKLILTLAILTINLTYCQNYGYKWSTPDPDFYYYLTTSFDVNNVFSLKPNHRMQTQIDGLDYDVEIGLKKHWYSPYIFYGQFKNAQINNYGLGLDAYLNLFYFLDTGIGAGWSRIEQKHEGGIGGFYLRGIASLPITNTIALTSRLQLQQRTDVTKGYIIEAAAGLTFKLHAKD